MYKEILKEDIKKPLVRLIKEFEAEIAPIAGEENAAAVAGALSIPSSVYDCEQNAEFLAGLDWNEAALFSVDDENGGKSAVIASHSIMGVMEALCFVKKLIKAAVDAGRDPKTVIDFACPMKISISGLPAIPGYDGGKYIGAFNHEDGNFGFIVSGTSALEFEAYLRKAAACGFVEIKTDSVAGNRFVLFSGKNGEMLYAYHSPMARRVCVVGGKNTYRDINVPGDGSICPLTVFQGRPSAFKGGMGMSYMLRLADGSYFVIDGGLNNNGEADELFEEMQRQNVRPDGRIIVRCWLITHGHNDHYNTMRAFIADRAGSVTVERIAFSTTHSDYRRNSDTPNHWDVRTGCGGFEGCEYVKPHAGQTWKLPGCEIEILFTAEDMFSNPFYVKSLNNASAVIRISAASQIIVFPGDIEGDSADIICGMYGDYLKCDILQIAHHGYHGASDEFYSLAAPSVVLYPIMEGHDTRWDDIGHGNYRWRRLPSITEVIPSYRGARTLELPYNPKS